MNVGPLNPSDQTKITLNARIQHNSFVQRLNGCYRSFRCGHRCPVIGQLHGTLSEALLNVITSCSFVVFENGRGQTFSFIWKERRNAPHHVAKTQMKQDEQIRQSWQRVSPREQETTQP